MVFSVQYTLLHRGNTEQLKVTPLVCIPISAMYAAHFLVDHLLLI